MINIDKQAVQAVADLKAGYTLGHADVEIIHQMALDAVMLLDELESQQTFQQAFFRQSLMYDVVAEAYEEAKEQIAKDVEIKARLCLESNSLFDRLRAAEKRIAELEARTVKLPEYRNSPDMHTKQFYEAIGFNQGLDVFIEALRAAGIGVKVE